MRLRVLLAGGWLFTVLVAAGTAAAQNPFAGTWKLNQEKSQMAGDLLRFGPAKGDAIEMTSGGTTYSFRTDGKTYSTPAGNAAIWRQTAPDSWTTEYRKLDNKLLRIDHWQLSSDGKTLSVTTSGAKPNGDLFADSETYVRTAGTSGLMGSWKSTEVKLSSPNELTIKEEGLDRLLFKIAALKASVTLNFDGKETPVEGPDIPSGLRLSLSRVGPYSFRLVQKLNGSVVSSSVYSVTATDPNTMTEVGGSPGDPPATVIWERQAPAAKAEPKAPVINEPTIGAPVRP